MGGRHMKWAIALVAAILGAGGMAFGADPVAELGKDPRNQPSGQSSSPNFGFQFYTPNYVEGGATDNCKTIPKQGDNRALVATDGVWMPENPDPIRKTIAGDTVTFEGRTGQCYYIVTGRYVNAGGGGTGGEGTPPTWQSDFNSDQGPYFVVYINESQRSDDDFFTMSDASRVTVELRNAEGITGSVHFKLSQEPLEGAGEILFVDADGSPVDPDMVRVVFPGESAVAYAKGAHVGVVSITAHQTDHQGNPPPVEGVPDVGDGSTSGAIVDSVWLVTHNPKWEKNVAQTRDYCKQAELMSNKLYVTCQETGDLRAELYEKKAFGDLLGHKYLFSVSPTSQSGGVTTFAFDPSKDSETDGHKTDADGAIYIEGHKLSSPSASSPAPRDFQVVIKRNSDDSVVKRQDVKIGPAIELLQFNKTKLLDLQSLDPYTDEYAYQMGGAGYGLQIDYNYYTWFKFLADCGDGIVQFENASQDEVTAVNGSRPGTMGANGKAYLIPNASELLEYNCWSHAVKWEGFDDTFHGQFNQHEEAQKTFMEGDPLPSPASPDNLVGEGCYKLTFGVKLNADPSQKQRFSVVFVVKHKKDSGPGAREF